MVYSLFNFSIILLLTKNQTKGKVWVHQLGDVLKRTTVRDNDMSYENYMQQKDELMYKGDKVFIHLGFVWDAEFTQETIGNKIFSTKTSFRVVKVTASKREDGYLQTLPLLLEKCFGKYTEDSYKEACDYFKEEVSKHI